MLVDHAEPERVRVLRVGDRLFAAADQDVALGRVVIAHDAFHQRALAGAVLAEQRVERAGPHLEFDIVERGKSPKRMVMRDGVDAERAAGKRRFADDHDSASDQRRRGRDRAEHAALHLDHLQRVLVVALVGGGAAILEQHAFEAAVVGLAHRGVDADVGGDAGQHDVLDAAQPQHQLEVGGAERALAGLVDDRLARQRRQIGDDLPAGLAAHQDAAARAGIADAGADLARAPALVGGQVGEVGAWPSRVWMM
jgi:hypothetical protein